MRKPGYDLDKIFEIVLEFNGETNYERLLDTILTKMMELTHSDAGTLYVVEDGMLHFRIIKNTTLNISQSADDLIELPSISLESSDIESVSAYSAINNEIVVIDDVYESKRFNFSGSKKYDEITGYRTRSMLVLPLCAFRDENTDVLGVIQLLNATDGDIGRIVPYGDIYNPPIIPAIANIAANTLANIRHIDDIRTLFHSFVTAMTQAIDERSKYNSNHTQKVVALCDAFIRYLNGRFPKGDPLYFSEKRTEELTMAAMLHDIGKIATPLNIMDKADRLGENFPLVRYRFEIKRFQIENEMLKGELTQDEYNEQNKALLYAQELIESAAVAPFVTDAQIAEIQKLSVLTYKDSSGEIVPLLEPYEIESLCIRKGTLTDSERGIMQEHAAVTGRILDSIAFSKYYADIPYWARGHHEFADGRGYPLGLSGEDIPTEIAIITIMDIFEALTASDRPYKKSMPVEKALGILSQMVDEGKLNGTLVALFRESRAWDTIV